MFGLQWKTKLKKQLIKLFWPRVYYYVVSLYLKIDLFFLLHLFPFNAENTD